MVSEQTEYFLFARYETWSFNNQRVVTEVKFGKEAESYSIILTSHGCKIDLTTLFQLECLEQSPNWKWIESVLTSIDNSTLCCGLPIKDGEGLHTMLPHESGIYSDLLANRTTKTVERRAFSANCSILSRAGQFCSSCKNLHYLEKMEEKETRKQWGDQPFHQQVLPL